MRIEIIGDSSGGTSTISGLYTDFDSLLTETDSVIDALKRMRGFSYNMSGGIGILQNAVGNVDSRLQAEEIKRNAISSAKGKCESFLQLVSTIDSQVAETVSVNKENFYSLNKWAKPSAVESTVESWYASAKEWIKDSVKTVTDYFTHSFEVYNETDFSELTTDELRAYYEELKKKFDSEDAYNDDKIRMNALYQYISQNATAANQLEYIKLHNEIYALLYPESISEVDRILKGNTEKIDVKEELFLRYYMTYGTDYNTARKLYAMRVESNNTTYGDISMIDAFDGNSASAKQGNFHIENMQVSRNADGSCDFSCYARQTSVASSYGAAVVYNCDGSIKEVVILDRYHNATDLPSAVKTIYNSWIGEDYSETKVDVNIPKGGYIQITDDPDEIVIIQAAKGVEEVVVDEVKDVIKDAIVDEIKDATGIGKIGKHDTDAVKWGGKVIGTAVKGYEAVKKSAEISDRLGNIYWSSKEKGTGSLIIYNS